MIDFSRVKLIAAREWRERVRMRSFRIATVIQVLAIVVAACVPTIVAWFTQDDTPEQIQIQVLDETGADLATRIGAILNADGTDTHVGISGFTGSQDELKTLVDDGDADAGVVINRNEAGALAFSVITSEGDADLLTQRIYSAAASIHLQDQLAQLGVPESELGSLQVQAQFTLQTADTSDGDADDADQAARYLIGYLAAFLSYMAILMYGTWVAQGVVEEKASRIMEIMVNVATPRDLLVGKVLGIGAAAFTQLIPMVVLGAAAFGSQKFIATQIGIDAADVPDIDFSGLSLQAGGVFLVFMPLGFLLYATLFAAIGSMVSRQEEVSQAVSPLTMFSIVGIIGATFTLSEPNSMFAKIVAMVPFTSGMAMVPRVLLGDPAWWELVLSAMILLISCAVAFWFAARIYRVGVLMYGQKPGWRSMFRKADIAFPR